jgi:hypothetical protein
MELTKPAYLGSGPSLEIISLVFVLIRNSLFTGF